MDAAGDEGLWPGPRRRAGGAGFVGLLRRLSLASLSLGVCGLLLFNYGFQMIRIPPSGVGIPYIELLTVVAAPFLFTPRVLSDLIRSPVGIPFVLWFAWGLIRIAASVQDHGMLAVRDGLPVIESVFLVVGFAMASRLEVIRRHVRYLPWFIAICIGYSLLSPFQSQLLPLSPTIPNTQGIPTPVFFGYTNTGAFLVAVSAYWWRRSLNQEDRGLSMPALVISFALILFPSRTVILQILGIIILFGAGGSKSEQRSWLSVIWVVFVATGIIAVVGFSGLEIAGRLGVLDSAGYQRLVSELFFWRADIVDNQLTSGGAQRILWWTDIITRTTDSFDTFILGFGYGEPLMKGVFHAGTITREPHNSWVSVFGRSGIVGLILFTNLCVAIIRVTFRQVRERSTSQTLGPYSAFLAALVIGTLIQGLGQTPFVMPFFAVPYYFAAGILARMALPVARRRGYKYQLNVQHGDPPDTGSDDTSAANRDRRESQKDEQSSSSQLG